MTSGANITLFVAQVVVSVEVINKYFDSFTEFADDTKESDGDVHSPTFLQIGQTSFIDFFQAAVKRLCQD